MGPSKRAKRNITGLKNQSSRPASSPEPPASPGSAESADDFSDSEALDIAELDSLTYLEVDSDYDDDNQADLEEVATSEFARIT